jgi:hypothetical protein
LLVWLYFDVAVLCAKPVLATPELVLLFVLVQSAVGFVADLERYFFSELVRAQYGVA